MILFNRKLKYKKGKLNFAEKCRKKFSSVLNYFSQKNVEYNIFYLVLS